MLPRRAIPHELLAALAVVAGYGLLAPSVVNGDGLGYARAAFYGGRYMGHLGYVPLLRFLGHCLGARQPVDFVLAGRVLSVAASALSVWLVGVIARRAGLSARAASLAAWGLAASFGLWFDGADVEVYAPALAALLVALYGARQRAAGGSWMWLLASVAALLCAVSMHMECMLFAGVLVVTVKRGDRLAATLLAAAPLAAIYGAVLPAGGRVGGLLSASHGLPNPHAGVMAPLAAIYGMGRTLVYSPYPYEAPLWLVATSCALGVGALLLALFWARRATQPSFWPTLAWLVPFSAVGIFYYASDSERWIFLLPLLWLRVASAVDGHQGRRRFWLLPVFLIIANLLLWIPTAHNDLWRRRAQAVPAQRGDLVIGPGHGWDEYVGFYDQRGVVSWPLVFFVARDGGEAARVELRERACHVATAGHRVLLVRFTDDDSPLGWKDLARLGWPGDRAEQLLPAGTRMRIAPGVDELRPDCH